MLRKNVHLEEVDIRLVGNWGKPTGNWGKEGSRHFKHAKLKSLVSLHTLAPSLSLPAIGSSPALAGVRSTFVSIDAKPYRPHRPPHSDHQHTQTGMPLGIPRGEFCKMPNGKYTIPARSVAHLATVSGPSPGGPS